MISESSIEPGSSCIMHNLTLLDSVANIDPDASAQFSESESNTNTKHHQTFSEMPVPIINPIKVAVVNPQMKQENLMRYTVYSIRGKDTKGSFEVERRYNDFAKIRHILSIRWPGCYIPPLPPKKFNNMDSGFVEERMRYLDLFCKRIAESPYLHFSAEYQIFIRSSRKTLDRELHSFETAAHEEIAQRYNEIFADIKDREVNNQTIAKIAEFRLALQKAVEHFGVIQEAAERFARKRKNFYTKMNAFHETVCVGYEKTIFNEYHNNSESGNAFIDSATYNLNENAHKVKEAIRNESIGHLCDWLETESIEVVTFLNVFTERDKYEHLKNKSQEKQQYATIELHDALKGRFNLKSMILGKSKQETKGELEKEIRDAITEIENFRVIHEMITRILAYREVDKFKANKLEKYYQVVKLAGGNELANLRSVYEYWDKVSTNDNIKD